VFAVRGVVWLTLRVSDWLVDIQNRMAGYPSWLVVGALLVVAAGLLFSVGKILRFIGGLLLVLAFVAAGWLAYRNYIAPPPASPPAAAQPATPAPAP
jgi:hypothetical protein